MYINNKGGDNESTMSGLKVLLLISSKYFLSHYFSLFEGKEKPRKESRKFVLHDAKGA